MNQARTLTFEFPLPRTHTGVALGNGTCGVMAWSKAPDCLNLTVSRNDFWDHRNGDRLWEGGTYERLKQAYSSGDPQDMRQVLSPGVEALWRSGARPSTLIPGGRLELKLAEGLTLKRAILDCERGRLRIEVDGRAANLELVLSPLCDVLWVDDGSSIVASVVSRPAWEWVEDEFTRRGFRPPARIDQNGACGWVQDCPEDPSLCALARHVRGGLAVALALGSDEQEATSAAAGQIAAFVRQGKAPFLAESDRWWARYWSRVPEVHIPDAFFAQFLLYAHYKFACATNPHSPRAAPLQGPWIEEYQFPPWGGDYTCNVNIQQIYTMTFTGRNLDHIMPLFDMLESAPFQETMQHNARVLLGIDDGLLMTHSQRSGPPVSDRLLAPQRPRPGCCSVVRAPVLAHLPAYRRRGLSTRARLSVHARRDARL